MLRLKYNIPINLKALISATANKNTLETPLKSIYFGSLKTEMFYGYESTFKTIDQLKQAISNYIDYCNNKQIKTKLKGLSPVQYRIKSFQ
ncbi:hypothetical protein BMI76_09460 [Streptococcus sp. 'caviae']|nr:hypothetical protein BMI76_09460 [Streptococcus sp. 'caviae']